MRRWPKRLVASVSLQQVLIGEEVSCRMKYKVMLGFYTRNRAKGNQWIKHVRSSVISADKATRGHGDRVVTLSPPTSEAGVRFPAQPQVGKLVVACRWLAVYSTEP